MTYSVKCFSLERGSSEYANEGGTDLGRLVLLACLLVELKVWGGGGIFVVVVVVVTVVCVVIKCFFLAVVGRSVCVVRWLWKWL